MAPCISGLQGSVLGPAFRVTPCHFLRTLLQRSYLPYKPHRRGWDRVQDPPAQLTALLCDLACPALLGHLSRGLGSWGGGGGLQRRMSVW